VGIPTRERAQQYFAYDQLTGVLTLKQRDQREFSPARYTSHMKNVGLPCSSKNQDGYVKVHMDGLYYSAHRIIWLMMTGEWVKYPDYEIDHLNRDRADNRWANLRKVTKSENQRNAGARCNNTSGIHGVNWKPKYNSKEGDGLWVARIWNGPRHVYLGAFKTLQEAAIARKAAERVLGFTGTGAVKTEREAGKA